jgi:hypothetical protein
MLKDFIPFEQVLLDKELAKFLSPIPKLQRRNIQLSSSSPVLCRRCGWQTIVTWPLRLFSLLKICTIWRACIAFREVGTISYWCFGVSCWPSVSKQILNFKILKICAILVGVCQLNDSKMIIIVIKILCSASKSWQLRQRILGKQQVSVVQCRSQKCTDWSTRLQRGTQLVL